nr:hypothetical protein [Ferrimicrobium acidiphilum]
MEVPGPDMRTVTKTIRQVIVGTLALGDGLEMEAAGAAGHEKG